jgi:hypothetical protein
MDSLAGYIATVCVSINWEALTAIGTIALALVALVSARYAKRQLEDAKRQLEEFRRESRIEHLMALVDQFVRDPMATHRRNLGARRTPNGLLVILDLNSPPPELHDVMNFFEHMGYLLEGQYLNLEDVYVEFHYWILHVWSDAKELIESEQAEYAIYYEFFEKMVTRLLNYDRPRTGRLEIPSEAEIAGFYIAESRLPSGSPIPIQRRSKPRSG